MGFLDESYTTLLSPLCRQSRKRDGPKGLHSQNEVHGSGHQLQEEGEHARYFDVVDIMEKGFARELVADFMEPLPDSRGLWKFSVVRSDDRQEYRLFCESGEFLMFARLGKDARRVDIFLYDPREKENALYDPARPAFSLACNAAKTDWRLTQERCDNCRHFPRQTSGCSFCRGNAELLRIKHSNVEVGDGVNHCMDVSIPGSAGQEGEELVTKMPTWNNKVECLVLDFKGRKVQASAKNFQLTLEEDDENSVICQYGKLGANTFGLDFRYPLTVAQAFGISLTTLHWV